MESTDIVDQRKHMRFRVKEGAFAVLMNPVTVGPIKDISMDGLAFTYISEDKLPQDSFTMDLLFGDDEGFYLKDIPSKIITDFETPIQFSFSSIPLRRCSVQFKEMNLLQIPQLESFIRNYTI